MAIIYFQNNYLTLYYHEADSLGHPVWTGFASGEEHRNSVLECIKLIQEEKPQFWLTDNRKMKAVRKADQDWFSQEIIPIMATSSLRKFAVLTSEDIFNQMAVENIHQQITKINLFEMKFFDNEATALAWLK
ncbi:STAS/SEC14 domain-containing protein [Adhaeribacter rhizoryzae]|uniref:STAS/SEC14 domain-containing protein n=1 Tax=Adhaeribacter rhizoryzae TaxID=2607907 RepID=A0A5M6DJP3_9BACT|nr:STAS/SEC14 domain-containing protein [Adhaeribacter rhizoryzae]KAA5546439.1 hypothetical protein F0145_11145 [Adhaeribacter rhizoryzae]